MSLLDGSVPHDLCSVPTWEVVDGCIPGIHAGDWSFPWIIQYLCYFLAMVGKTYNGRQSWDKRWGWDVYVCTLQWSWHWAILGTSTLVFGARVPEDPRFWVEVCVWLQSSWLTPGQCVSQSVVWEGMLGASETSGLTAGGHGSAAGAPPGWLMRACLKSSRGEWTPFISCCTLHTPGPTSHCCPLRSVNSWNATLLRARSGMKLRWTDSNMIDSLRIFSICLLWL